MRSGQFKFITVGLLLLTLITLSHCGKPRLFGKDMEIRPIIKVFSIQPAAALQAAKEALAYNGYNVQKEDDAQGLLETHWQPTTSDSHYVLLFNRQDRGTVGAYHKLVIKVTAKGSDSQVEIYSLAKSFVSNLKSTGIEEEKVLTKIADFTRKQNIDVTNVGIQ
jgi:uncharacterized lipoprotein